MAQKITTKNISLPTPITGYACCYRLEVCNNELVPCNTSDFVQFAGSTAGFHFGKCFTTPGTCVSLGRICSFPFASDTTNVSFGNLSNSCTAKSSGTHSATHGYSSGGVSPSLSPASARSGIDKFPMSSSGNATCVADLTVAMTCSSSNTYVENCGFLMPISPSPVKSFETHPFASDDNATCVGNITPYTYNATGSSSFTHGYQSGFNNPTMNNIVKFSFTSSFSASCVATLVPGNGFIYNAAGISSPENGYVAGGPNTGNSIRKFPFSSDTNSSQIGTLAVAVGSAGGVSSVDNGYVINGWRNPQFLSYQPSKQRFPFASDAPATNITNEPNHGALAPVMVQY